MVSGSTISAARTGEAEARDGTRIAYALHPVATLRVPPGVRPFSPPEMPDEIAGELLHLLGKGEE